MVPPRKAGEGTRGRRTPNPSARRPLTPGRVTTLHRAERVACRKLPAIADPTDTLKNKTDQTVCKLLHVR